MTSVGLLLLLVGAGMVWAAMQGMSLRQLLDEAVG